MATVRQVGRSAPASTAATVPQQGAFSTPPSLTVYSHKETVDYLTQMPQDSWVIFFWKGISWVIPVADCDSTGLLFVGLVS